MKDRYNLLILSALEFFIEKPYEEIHLREFSRRLKISLNSAQRFLNLFLKNEFVKEERKANLRYFKANLENAVFRQIKIAYSLNMLIKEEFISKLKETGVSHAILFGSTAEGKDDEKSDVDLTLIGINKLKAMEIVRKKQEECKKEISPHFFSLAEWKKQAKGNKAFYLDVLTKGISLIGEKPIVD